MILENWPRPIKAFLLWLLGIQWVHSFLTRLSADKPSKFELLERIFQRNHFDVQATGEDKLPESQGYIIATNHPHGLFDGLAAMWLGSKNGHDSRAIGRHFLSVFEPIKNWFLLIEIDKNRKARASRQVLEQSVAFIESGGSLIVTPAGRVSISRPVWKQAKDLPWKSGVIQLHNKAQTPIVLVYVDVNHSVIRQLGQSIHGVVRALLQVWAFRFGRSQKLHLHVLDVINPGDIPEGTAKQQTQWLQTRFDKLAAELKTAHVSSE